MILFDLDASRKQGRVHPGLYSMTNTRKKLPELGHVDLVVGDEESGIRFNIFVLKNLRQRVRKPLAV
jgi:hypothetical protein